MLQGRQVIICPILIIPNKISGRTTKKAHNLDHTTVAQDLAHNLDNMTEAQSLEDKTVDQSSVSTTTHGLCTQNTSHQSGGFAPGVLVGNPRNHGTAMGPKLGLDQVMN
jgi:hypothetical protein